MMNLEHYIVEIRKEFPALQQQVNGKPLVYLDNAATSQKPQSVLSLTNLMNSRINGNIHRAVHSLSGQSTALYEEARDKIAHFINAKEREEIIFTSGTTASINLLAYSLAPTILKKGDSILISGAEHHSNIVPWQMACERLGANLKILPIDSSGNWEMHKLPQLLDEGVKIISVAHISNILGLVNPIEELIALAKERGVVVVIDAAQSIHHREIDVQKLDCDFLAFSGHKMYGATGIGVLYGKRTLLEKIPPFMGGGDMVDRVTFKKTTYAPPPLKFEAGTPNFIGGASLAKAIEFLESIDKVALSKYEDKLIEYVLNELQKIPNLKLFGSSKERIPLFSFVVEGVHPSDIAMIVDKMGVALRSGQMCSEPLMDHFGVEAMLRASFAHYNTIEEASIFIESLKRAIKMLS
ncbi:MAG: SufS family cysteine desulfurase [Bacteroidales bacterium]